MATAPENTSYLDQVLDDTSIPGLEIPEDLLAIINKGINQTQATSNHVETTNQTNATKPSDWHPSWCDEQNLNGDYFKEVSKGNAPSVEELYRLSYQIFKPSPATEELLKFSGSVMEPVKNKSDIIGTKRKKKHPKLPLKVERKKRIKYECQFANLECFIPE